VKRLTITATTNQSSKKSNLNFYIIQISKLTSIQST